jgi:hypothetical protein
VIKILVEILKIHYALLFSARNWLRDHGFERFIPLGKYTWGIIFLVHDWLTNLILTFEFEKPPVWSELVTGRMRRYKDTLPKGTRRRDWADEMGEFANVYDEGHY